MEVRLAYFQVVVEKDVDVDYSVFVAIKTGFVYASQFVFNFLCGFQEVVRSEGGVDADAGVDEFVWTFVAPGGGFIKR